MCVDTVMYECLHTCTYLAHNPHTYTCMLAPGSLHGPWSPRRALSEDRRVVPAANSSVSQAAPMSPRAYKGAREVMAVWHQFMPIGMERGGVRGTQSGTGTGLHPTRSPTAARVCQPHGVRAVVWMKNTSKSSLGSTFGGMCSAV